MTRPLAHLSDDELGAVLRDAFDFIDPTPPHLDDQAKAAYALLGADPAQFDAAVTELWRTRICPAVTQTGAADHPAPARPPRLDPAAAGHQTPTQEDAQGWVSGHCGSTSVSGERPQLGSGALSSDPHGRGAADRAAAVSGSHPQTASSEAPPVAELLAPPLGRAAEAKAAALPNTLTTAEDAVPTTVTRVPAVHQDPARPGGSADEADAASAVARAASAAPRRFPAPGVLLALAVGAMLGLPLGALCAGLYLIYLT